MERDVQIKLKDRFKRKLKLKDNVKQQLNGIMTMSR